MIRKVTLALLAAVALGATALMPSAASAHGWGWHGGFGYHGFYGGPTVVVGGYGDSCVQRRIVDTPWGPRVRLVNVCGY